MKTWTRFLVPVVAFQLVLSTPIPARAGDFVGAAGNYGGVLGATEPGNGEVAESGLVQVQVTESGSITGFVMWQNQRYTFKGVLASDGICGKTFPKKGVDDPVTLGVLVALNKDTLSISGLLTETPAGASEPTLTVPFSLTGAPADPALTAVLEPGVRVSFIDPPNPPSEGGSGTGGSSPQPTTMSEPPAVGEIPGDGFSRVQIGNSTRRSARIVGRLPDYDGAYSAGSPMRGSKYAVFSSLYKKKKAHGGQLFGQATVQDNGNATPSLQSQLRWGKAQGYDPLFYPDKIDKNVTLDAVPYPKVKRGALPPLLPAGAEATKSINASMTFRRGNLRVPRADGSGNDSFFKVSMAMGPFSSRIVGPNPYQVRMTVNAFTGSFSGSFMHPVLNVRTKFSGAFQSSILTVPGIGRGNFRMPVKDPARLAPLNGAPLESGGVTVSVKL